MERERRLVAASDWLMAMAIWQWLVHHNSFFLIAFPFSAIFLTQAWAFPPLLPLIIDAF
jgi:hypothetical protein